MTGAESAFDKYAQQYDVSFTETHVGKLLRNRVWKFLEQNCSPSTHPKILEINCGTGEDAAWLASRGFDVTATDISEEMVAVAKAKAESRGLKIKTQACSFDHIHTVFQPETFDIIFSDFGGLNCVDETALKKLSSAFSSLLKPGGKFIAVVMSRDCWWERRYFRRKGNEEAARRRESKNGVTAQIEGKSFTTWYYSSEEFYTCFADHFIAEKKFPVGWMLPPSYLDSFFRKRKFLLSFFSFLETNFSRPRHANKADHFLIQLRKK